MNILPFQLNVPAEVILDRPEGTLVRGRYGDRVMFRLADGRVMYVPPFVANKIEAEGLIPGEPFQVCKTQVRKGSRRSIEWTVRRLDPAEKEPGHTEPAHPNGAEAQSDRRAPELEPETRLERDLRESIESLSVKRNGNGHHAANTNGVGTTNGQPPPTTKLEHALKTAISAAHNAERFGAELGYVVRFDADAIKSMAITVLINMSGANHR
jgi:hypothetical protein